MSDPMKVPCDQVIRQLWEYIDGEMESPRTEEQVREHLRRCSHCYPQYDFERAYLEFVRRTAAQCVPPGLRERVFRCILEGAASEPGDSDPLG